MGQLSLAGLKKIVRGFERSTVVPASDVTFEVDQPYTSGGGTTVIFTPHFKNITSLRQLADICEATDGPLMLRQLQAQESTNAAEAVNFASRLTSYAVNLSHLDKGSAAKIPGSNVKFWPGSDTVGFVPPELRNNGNRGGWGAQPSTPALVWPEADLNGHLISGEVHEVMEDGINYRILRGEISTTNMSNEDAVFVVTPEHRAYNYLDRNHIVFFVLQDGEWELVITNSLGLDATYLMAGFPLNHGLLKDALADGVFLRNGPGVRVLGLKMEQWATQSKYAELYRGRKEKIRQNYEQDAQNMLTGKLLRGEVPTITINEIAFSSTRAEYNTISIESADLADVVFSRLDVNSQFDIYQVIQVYVEHIMHLIKQTPLNSGNTAFSEAKTFNFQINGIPIRIEIENTNTRRKVNGHYINTAEVARVVNRAACHTNANDFNNFVKTAAYMTLEARDILANGLPIYVYRRAENAAADRQRQQQGGVQNGVNVIARMLFSKNGREVSLCLDNEKKTTVPIKRFVSFYRAVQQVNTKTDGGYIYDGGSYGHRNSEWCRRKVKELIQQHAVDADGNALTTPEQRDAYIENVLILRTQEEKRSLELLQQVAKQVKAEEGTHNGKVGYFIRGVKTRYFVELEAPFRVWEADTGRYVCIVDHNRENIGVGFDGLVARLLMLANDGRFVNKVHTVAALV